MPSKQDSIAGRRPHCPKCDMRMIAPTLESNKFECFRCGYIGSANPQGHAPLKAA
jgi:uncharacterized paraquat-inducible protein A